MDCTVAITCRADQLGTLGAREEQLQPFGRQWLIVGNEHTEEFLLSHSFPPALSAKL